MIIVIGNGAKNGYGSGLYSDYLYNVDNGLSGWYSQDMYGSGAYGVGFIPVYNASSGSFAGETGNYYPANWNIDYVSRTVTLDSLKQ